jgi:DNA-binding transcriptional MerR regulator
MEKIDNPILINDLKVCIYKSDFFDIVLSDYFFSEEGKNISKKLNNKNNRLDHNEISYRLINHWEKLNIVDPKRDVQNGWRKFSIIDLVWICIVNKLRIFGISLDQILHAKEQLSKIGISNIEFSEYPLLEMYVMLALLNKLQVHFYFFENGTVDLATQAEADFSSSLLPMKDHLQIDINNLVKKIFPKITRTPKNEITFSLKPEELDLIYMLRMDNFESIRIKLEDGKIERIEGTEILENDSRIIDIIRQQAYQNIEIKQKDGKTVQIKRTIFKKPE